MRIAGLDFDARAVREDERAACTALVDRWFGGCGSLARTYPQVFGPGARGRTVGLFDRGAMRAHAATYPVAVRTGDETVRATLVGCVATDPAFRGQGFATELLGHVIGQARREERDVLMLWSDQWAFYERLGFRPAGTQLEVSLRCAPEPPHPGVRAAAPADVPAIARLHDRKPCRSVRDRHELELLLSAAPMTTLVLERGGEVVAYACHGKGLDFTGWWHEVGGADQDVVELLRGAAAGAGGGSSMLMAPFYRRGIVALLGSAVLAVHEGAAALCLPLSRRGRVPVFVDGLDSI